MLPAFVVVNLIYALLLAAVLFFVLNWKFISVKFMSTAV